MSRPTALHYGPGWVEECDATERACRQLFGTANELLVMFGPGSVGLEAALGRVLSRGGQCRHPYKSDALSGTDAGAIAFVHHEIMLGVEHEMLVIADAVSSLGGIPAEFDMYQLDVCVGVDDVVIILTGAGWKDAASLRRVAENREIPLIDADQVPVQLVRL